MTPVTDASREQIRAADPAASVWVTANAGSGKTKVLTDRVARLLLDGTPPGRILCLTYTRAAAAEMQIRLFERLGEWAMLAEAELSVRLADLGLDPGTIDADARRSARRLFARALETPGGLKIQTIHSFCAGLLRRFPLEAGVSPGFTEMEERAGRLLRGEIVETLAERQPDLFNALAAHLTGEDLEPLLTEISARADLFRAPGGPDTLRTALGLPPGYAEADLLGEVFLGGEAALMAELVPLLRASGKTDSRAGAALAALDLAQASRGALATLETVLLYGEQAAAPFGAKIGSFPTKALRQAETGWLGPLEALMTRVEAARPRRLALGIVERTEALAPFARAFLNTWEARKQAHGWLDFDDLIGRARHLLSDSAVAQWVLFKLDGGLDHILVDEAQDTSPAQWDVIWRLAEEFTTGQGARGALRTVFVVGDEKQSIYSFQGADPAAFARMRDKVAQHLAGTGAPLSPVALDFSFRSAEAVLRVVDMTFRGEAARGVAPEMQHRPFKARMAGRVDLWPLVPTPEKPDAPPWDAPVDSPAANDPPIVLAGRIAGAIHGWLARGERLPVEDRDGPRDRPLTPGDIMILVQRRSHVFHEIIRGLKAEGLPVAGADVLRVGAELSVKDLTALLAFLSTPEDDLSLAVVLRSPLCGLSEDALYRLAHGREGYLRAALRARAAEHPQTTAMLDDLRAAADFLRPYELLERALTRHGGRERLIARLGAEAEDGIDALLAQALAYERAEVPSLAGFLGWLAAAEVTAKRRADSAGGLIRVMTVHGAKGLQAPVVILPDTIGTPGSVSRKLYALGDGPAWAGVVAELPAPLADARRELAEAMEEERRRLLYVAMTRAENWLVLCGAGKPAQDGSDWYGTLAAGIEAAGGCAAEMPGGEGLRVASGRWPDPAPTRADTAPPPSALPRWARNPPPSAPRPPEPLSPSDLGGEKALPGGAEGIGQEAAKRHGLRLHKALEWLPGQPRAERAAILARLFATGPDAATPAELARVAAEAEAILDAPDLAHLFAPGSLTEAGITAPLDVLGGREVLGYIDRLVVEPGRVLAVDFKSNALVPDRPGDVPEDILRQMGAYAAALAGIWPGRRIETAILWTRTARLMQLPHDLVTAALARAGTA